MQRSIVIRRLALVGMLLLGGAVAARARADAPPTVVPPSLPDIVAPLLGAVVNISVLKHPEAVANAAEASDEKTRPQHSLGSGFIIDPDGTIVTNRHVVAGGYSVAVTLDDNRQFAARVIASNLYPDLALLKIDASEKLPTVRFGNSDALRLGETVFAIGNPLGLSGSISVGVVSALNRNVKSTVIDDFIQTDAAINHGNSGGPLFNMKGEVVGVNWALIAPSDSTGSVGLGLAIPSKDAEFVVDQMRRIGRLNPGFPGMALQAVTPALAGAFGLTGTEGGIVTDLLPGGPADKAGIRQGDVVLQIGAARTQDARALQRELVHFPPGSVAPVVLWRAGRTMSMNLTMAEFPAIYDPAGPPAMDTRGPRTPSPTLGMRLAPMSEAARASFGLPGYDRGVVIEGVATDSAAADLGLGRGDVIERVQDARVATPEEVVNDLAGARAQGHETVPVLLRSQGRLQWMVIPLGEL